MGAKMLCLLKQNRYTNAVLAKLVQTQKGHKIMTAEIYLNREQETKFFEIYEKQGFTGTNQELVQQLFNEALTANYLLCKGGLKDKPKQERLLNIEFDADTEDYPTDEEIAEIMQELYEQENE